MFAVSDLSEKCYL